MSETAAVHTAELAILAGSAGFAFGLLYFATLKRSIAVFAGGRGLLAALGLTLARFAAAVVFLGLAAQFGAAVLLAALVGFLLARTLALRSARRSS
jgi:N-ATPase, AtpR subunit